MVEVSFLCAPRWRIFLPDRVELWQDGRKAGEAVVPGGSGATPWTKYKLKCRAATLRPDAPVQLRVTQSDEVRKPTVAVDEIDVF